MRNKRIHVVAAGVLTGLLLAGAAGTADQPMSQAPYMYGDDAKLPNGVIGVSLQVGAEPSAIPPCSMSEWCIPRDRLTRQGSDMEMRL